MGLAILLAACASQQTEQASTCPDISGKYADSGEAYADRGEINVQDKISVSLTAAIFRGWINWEQTKTVSFSQPNSDTLEIEMLADNGITFKTQLKQSRNEFHCQEGSVIMTIDDEYFEKNKIAKYAKYNLFFFGSSKHVLFKPAIFLSKTNGQLMMKNRDTYIDLSASPIINTESYSYYRNPEITRNTRATFKAITQ